MKGQPWSVEEEKQLRQMLQEHRRLNEIAAFFGKSPESVKKKINRLNLKVVVLQIPKTTTSNDLPSVEKEANFIPNDEDLYDAVLFYSYDVACKSNFLP